MLPAVKSSRLSRPEWRALAVIMAVVLGMNVVAWTVLLDWVVPLHLKFREQVFGVGLGITAFTLGMRHAFDAGDACANFPGKHYEEWELDDPAGLEVTAVQPVRDDIERLCT